METHSALTSSIRRVWATLVFVNTTRKSLTFGGWLCPVGGDWLSNVTPYAVGEAMFLSVGCLCTFKSRTRSCSNFFGTARGLFSYTKIPSICSAVAGIWMTYSNCYSDTGANWTRNLPSPVFLACYWERASTPSAQQFYQSDSAREHTHTYIKWECVALDGQQLLHGM